MIRVIELLVVGYVVLGMMGGVPGLSYVAIAMSVFLQLVTLIYSVLQFSSLRRGPFMLWIVNVFIITAMSVWMIFAGESLSMVLNRALSLLSVFGLVGVLSLPRLRVSMITKMVVTTFAVIGVIIVIDSIYFLLGGSSLWPPDIYLGNRFSGPFFDPNFMALNYAVMFLVVFFGKLFASRRRLFILGLCTFMVILGLSWSVIAVLVLSVILGFVLKAKNYGAKQIIIVAVYLIAVPTILVSMPSLYKSFESITGNFGVSSEESYLKLRSFEYRVEAQDGAISGIMGNPMGHGPQSMVQDLGRDTHNSYLGFAYELGIFGVLLIILNMTYRRKCRYVVADALTTFIYLMALSINVHYMSIFAFIVLIVFSRDRFMIEGPA